MLEYTVKIAWDTEYDFDDGRTALQFAEIAVDHSATDRSKSVSIVIRKAETDEEVEEDE